VPAFDYLTLSYRWGRYCTMTYHGESVLEPTEGAARQALRTLIAASMAEERSAMVRENENQRKEHDHALTEWTQRRDEAMAAHRIDVVEETVRKMGKYTVRKERVVLPDGTSQTFDMGEGTAFVERAALDAVGEPPSAPDLEDLSEDEYLDRALVDAHSQVVGRWMGTVLPADPEFNDHLVEDVSASSVTELNRFGSQGWQLVDVSEDRTITSGDRDGDTSTIVTGVRYTLMRERST
jgi:hypothetical protein